jgi:cytochrome c
MMLQIFIPFFVFYAWMFRENEEPRIYFKQPSPHFLFQWNAAIPYLIAVEDKEDGTSELGEIPPNEVFLKIKFATDQSTYDDFLKDEHLQASAWKNVVANSCFSCHALHDKLAGPSFEQITAKYGSSEATIHALAPKILKGSKGTWGDSQTMPSHPDMPLDVAKDIVRWLLRSAADKDLQIITGPEGSVKTRSQPPTGTKGFYILIASYRDRGTDGQNQKEAAAIMSIPSEP